ncbi:ATP-binding protein [Kutzneria viridogrisea]|uniref:histidine kinase n=2 Tax=Kutzneria TaxID=43356 RepID=W5WLP4_9PSEU|nr:ATP-binding protein [Kutzneria albida]AHH99089.1 hypothetical protein KALB_5728 [Kutzneria albida DSM 43870]MBA8923356.1 signal transduction histidine kinase [Kutzneria viridogrisea]
MGLTVRARITALYGLLFVVGGLVLVLVVYLLVKVNLVSQVATAVSAALPVNDDAVTRTIPTDIAAVSQDIAVVSQNTVLTKLIIVSVVSLVVLAVLAVAVGWWISGRVLRPLHRISATAQRLSSENLHERIALGGPPDELTELAETFNDMLDRLADAFESQRRFIANASHELRTPLSIQRALVQIGLSEKDFDKVSIVREQLLAANRRSERLIDGLLVLARSDRGLENREPVALHEVVAHELAAAPVGALEVRTSLDDCWVLGDPVLISQLVSNLVGNAVRHNVDGGQIRVHTHARTGLLISNTGPEVDAARLPELFEPFRRGAERTRGAEGSGLGLSIVRSIVRAHGGAVHAYPRRGGGLEVSVTLPTAVPALS